MSVRLLIDEMHSPRVAEVLRAERWDAFAVAADSSLRGRPDASLLEYATESGRVMVTENSGDFARLAALIVASGEDHCGIIITSRARYFRGSPAYPNNVIEALRRFLAAPPHEGTSWIWWLE
ncbi:DUF5615 family PIN-like protein [Candidatus Poriferisodalis sp.]|uniref:DUF5615 family PIN-like protein n=1 Tax=Candidatus Poriferisodalis sp. TaxID=3101277 RepID=UPI003C6EE879